MTWQTKLMDVEYEALERGREEGMQQGVEKGICASIQLMRDISYSKDTAIEKIMEQFQLTSQVAEEKVALYRPQ